MKKIIFKIINIPAEIYNKVFMKLKKVKCGKNVQIKGKLFLRGYGSLEIGDNVLINSKPFENPVAGGSRTSFNFIGDGKIKIGNGVGISHSAITAMKSVEIGDNVLIGSACMIADTDFHPITLEKSLHDDLTKVEVSSIKIENNVFIGARSIILKGVTIGEGAVVGAGSVVTKDIPPGEIWAGNPAKFIKKVKDEKN
ncbi:MAG: acyltransferase [Clostridia bacterium]|nr:acyltransferase [Clostridia bacterium]